MVVLGSFFFHPRKSGCPISGYANGGLEVHSVPLLRQPQPATFLLTYLPALPTAECLLSVGARGSGKERWIKVGFCTSRPDLESRTGWQ
ncbi:hypothetical protein EVAR_61409_1 [Eumeta japonica]|uniref:Uncharacterized protein n=1 Tax=Eumeta variegata TaxID=151549 RepID=A0A4C1YUI2_EUMVA|nr:hypothetical protein EVAR_61409_1 [Eumeta japonica]